MIKNTYHTVVVASVQVNDSGSVESAKSETVATFPDAPGLIEALKSAVQELVEKFVASAWVRTDALAGCSNASRIQKQIRVLGVEDEIFTPWAKVKCLAPLKSGGSFNNSASAAAGLGVFASELSVKLAKSRTTTPAGELATATIHGVTVATEREYLAWVASTLRD